MIALQLIALIMTAALVWVAVFPLLRYGPVHSLRLIAARAYAASDAIAHYRVQRGAYDEQALAGWVDPADRYRIVELRKATR